MTFVYSQPSDYQDPLRRAIFSAYRRSEVACIHERIQDCQFDEPFLQEVTAIAEGLVQQVRTKRLSSGGLDAFLTQYHLQSEEGIALMCLAEALLRIPDQATADRLIRDKLAKADWESHLGQSNSLFVNAATWALMLTGKIIHVDNEQANQLTSTLKSFLTRSSEPVIRTVLNQTMKILGRQFVMGRTIDEAINRAVDAEKIGYRYSYDMLGEAAKTADDALRYLQSYEQAIHSIGRAAHGQGVQKSPGISVKLSALYPRYEFAKRDAALAALVPRLLELVLLAKKYQIGITVDAEEATRLDLSLDIIAAVFADQQLNGYEGFGLAVQSYQKRAPFVIDWLAALSRRHLIKGAYWDSEIKVSQEFGLVDYPVYTRKWNTDVSFLACASRIIKNNDAFYPQFATHNAQTVSAIIAMTKRANITDFEFQCLHGMGRPLYDEIVPGDRYGIPCRIYAPVGSHEDLLAYLVRRLLENGANSSFVNRIIDENAPVSEIIMDPVQKSVNFKSKTHPLIPNPAEIYGNTRKNSHGMDLTHPIELEQLSAGYAQSVSMQPWQAACLLGDGEVTGAETSLFSPIDQTRQIGTVVKATAQDVERALAQAEQGFVDWEFSEPEMRAQLLEKAANLLEEHQIHLMCILTQEGGKTLADANSEVREAVDFCRYYAEQARLHLQHPIQLPGPTGESNRLEMRGRGIALCISPWNFPLAIFLGQVTAALAAGNVVIAKPADQTSLIATAAIKLLHQAGFPRQVVQLLIGRGSQIGTPLVADLRVKAILFTGSTETAQMINQTLAQRGGAMIPFIAETGGQNAMLVDSSALPEQVVTDVVTSAFGSAGQRCSALRVIFIQNDVADKIITMMKGAMVELTVGDPNLLATDIGPVIDESSKKTLAAHVDDLKQRGFKLIHQVTIPDAIQSSHGIYFAPCAFEIPNITVLEREVFGPVLHVIRYREDELDAVIAAINSTGYGLTFGIHSRVEQTVDYVQRRIRAGNCYVNRSMIGAVVGVQPFGGEGLSGTGPKAGGPHYLLRLCHERTVSINTVAAGGNASLVSLQQDIDSDDINLNQ
jgi:RHH-type proline utilization regulon transcriptional repressor/proline dehydrogenase/delta 1-pyrroline-5-carboxylate dehydrogenase